MRALAGVDTILHAGDFDADDVLVMLEAVAPVVAVRGNMDTSGTVSALPRRLGVAVEGVDIVMQHRPFGARLDGEAASADVLVHGHTHEPFHECQGDQLVLNPGAVFQPRRGSSPTLALLTVDEGSSWVEFVELTT